MISTDSADLNGDDDRRLRPDPPRPALIERPGAEHRLSAWTGYRATLLTAAGGYGKTILAHQVTQHARFPVHWLCLEHTDSDETDLLCRLADVLTVLNPADRELVISHARDVRAPAHAAQILLDAVRRVDQPIGIVIDDCHRLVHSPALELLGSLLQRSPAHLHWLLIARRAPQLPFSRLRLAGELLELTEQDLHLTHDEARRLLERQSGGRASAPVVDLLARRSDGWIAGLKLLSLLVPADAWADPAQLPGLERRLSGTAAGISAYLVEEILQQLPTDLEDFLLRTAFLPRLNADLCDTVTGRNDSSSILAAWLDRRLFLQPLEAEPGWFIVHQLLRDTLCDLAEQRFDRTARRAAGQRAADWYAASGNLYEALRLFLQIDAVRQAVTLLARESRTLLAGNHLYELERLLRLLPSGARVSHPALLHASAWLEFLLGRYPQSYPLIAQLRAAGTTDARAAAELTALELFADYTRMQTADLCNRARAALLTAPADASFARGWLNLAAAVAFQATADDARDQLDFTAAALTEFQRDDVRCGEMMVVALHAGMLLNAGRLSECIVFCRDAVARVERLAQRAIALDLRQNLFKIHSEACFLRHDTETALAVLDTWAADAALLQHPLMQFQISVRRLLYAAAAPPRTDVEPLLQQIRRWLNSAEVHTRPAADNLQLLFDTLRLAERSGLTAQLPVVLEAGRIPTADPAPDAPALVWLCVTYTRVLCRRLSPSEYEQLEQKAAALSRSRTANIQAWLETLLTLDDHLNGLHDRARSRLRRVLRLIEAQDAGAIVLSFPALRPVLQAVDTRLSRAMLQRLPPLTVAEPLFTGQRLRVAELLQQGLRPAAIAAEIGLAVSSVRYHLTGIYRTLEVHDFHAAVAALRRFAARD